MAKFEEALGDSNMGVYGVNRTQRKSRGSTRFALWEQYQSGSCTLPSLQP